MLLRGRKRSGWEQQHIRIVIVGRGRGRETLEDLVLLDEWEAHRNELKIHLMFPEAHICGGGTAGLVLLEHRGWKRRAQQEGAKGRRWTVVRYHHRLQDLFIGTTFFLLVLVLVVLHGTAVGMGGRGYPVRHGCLGHGKALQHGVNTIWVGPQHQHFQMLRPLTKCVCICDGKPHR